MITANRLRAAQQGPAKPRPPQTIPYAEHAAIVQQMQADHAEEVQRLKARIAELEGPSEAKAEEVAPKPSEEPAPTEVSDELTAEEQELADFLEAEHSAKELKALASEAGASASGTKAELAKGIVLAQRDA